MFLNPNTVQNDERLRPIEERIAWLERHVLEQDKAMLELSETLSRVRRELETLRSRVAAAAADGQAPGQAGDDERPPHY